MKGQPNANHPDGLYRDNLCFFCCLALHREPDIKEDRLEEATLHLFQTWCDSRIALKVTNPMVDSFPWVTIYQLSNLKVLFKVDIDVFMLDLVDGKRFASVQSVLSILGCF